MTAAEIQILPQSLFIKEKTVSLSNSRLIDQSFFRLINFADIHDVQLRRLCCHVLVQLRRGKHIKQLVVEHRNRTVEGDEVHLSHSAGEGSAGVGTAADRTAADNTQFAETVNRFRVAVSERRGFFCDRSSSEVRDGCGSPSCWT